MVDRPPSPPHAEPRAKATPGRHGHDGGHRTWSIFHKWRAALFVASVTAILHHESPWLDQMDSVTYAAVSSFQRLPAPRRPPDVVWLYGIDTAHFTKDYREKAPLDRCVVARDLSRVFAAVHEYNRQLLPPPGEPADPRQRLAATTGALLRMLEVVVVDLDLAPIVAPISEREHHCQTDLELLLRGQSPMPRETTTDLTHLTGPRPALGPVPLRVILMEPGDVETNGDTQTWMREMQAGGVRFGTPWIRSNFGMVTRYACDPRSLPSVAAAEVGGSNDCIDRTAADFRRNCDARVDCHGQAVIRVRWIDPERFRDVDRRRDTDGGSASDGRVNGLLRMRFAESATPPPVDRDRDVRAVFVGATFGNDVHITPLNQLYGVELHAATFLSMLQPTDNVATVVAIAIDVCIGLAFAILIHLCWTRHLDARRSKEPDYTAWAWLAVLAAGYAGVLLITSFASLAALRFLGVWLSPLPMAIGMLIESAVSGQTETVGEYLARRRSDRSRGGADRGSTSAWSRFIALRDEGKWLSAILILGGSTVGPVIWLGVVGYAVIH